MTCKILAYLELGADETFSYERYDVAVGPTVVTVPAGNYVIGGIEPRVVTTASGSSVINVGLGHQFNIGDTVNVWDSSASQDSYTELTIWNTTGAQIYVDETVSVALGDVVYVSDDLISVIWGRLIGIDYVNLNGHLTIEIDSQGRVTWTLGEGEQGELLWQGDVLNEWLRCTEDMSLGDVPTVGERCHAGGFYPSKVVVEDIGLKTAIKSTSTATDGTKETLYAATHRKHRLTLRYQGGPRSTDWVEAHAAEDLWDRWVAQGAPARYYPDRTVTSRYAVKTNPTGWETWTVESASDWDPAQWVVVGGIYDWFEWALMLAHYAD